MRSRGAPVSFLSIGYWVFRAKQVLQQANAQLTLA